MTKSFKEKVNVPVKKGDHIFIFKARNGQECLEGQICEVTAGGASNVSVRGKGNNGSLQTFSLYKTNPSDEYVIADPENIVEALKVVKEIFTEKIKELDVQIDFHTKYKSEEEYVAYKLDTLINEAVKGGKKTDRVALMTTLLKELKSTNMI